jgi:hypothetical protein
MMTLIVLLIFAVVAILLLYRSAHGHHSAIKGLADLEGQTQPVDLAAFQNLIASDEESFLREHLPAADFRKVQRLRMMAALDYIRRTAHNASVLLQLGEAARASSDPQISLAGQELMDSALHLRMIAMMAQGQCYVRILLPTAQLSPDKLLKDYRSLTERVARLCQLENPAQVSRVAATL